MKYELTPKQRKVYSSLSIEQRDSAGKLFDLVNGITALEFELVKNYGAFGAAPIKTILEAARGAVERDFYPDYLKSRIAEIHKAAAEEEKAQGKARGYGTRGIVKPTKPQ